MKCRECGEYDQNMLININGEILCEECAECGELIDDERYVKTSVLQMECTKDKLIHCPARECSECGYWTIKSL